MPRSSNFFDGSARYPMIDEKRPMSEAKMFWGGTPAFIAASTTLNRPAQALKNGFSSDATLSAT